jgi:hypothetical protein
MSFELASKKREQVSLLTLYDQLSHTFSLDKRTRSLMITMFHEFLKNSNVLGDFSWANTREVWDEFANQTQLDASNEDVLRPNLSLSLFLACRSIVILNLNGERIRGNGLSLTSFLDKTKME